MAQKPTDAQEEPQETAAQAEPKQEPAAKEQAAKPKARRSSEAKAKAAAEGEEATAEPEAEAKPQKKPRRSPAKKPADAEATAEAEEESDAAAEQPKPAGRRSRSRAEAAPEPAPRPEPLASYDGPVRIVRAHARHVRVSARKARLVCDHLRGKSVEEARAILAFNPRGVALDWSKVLESAIANAENNHELLAEDLVVREAFADEGPTIKRFRPRARGRASSIRKRTSHLTIALAPERR
jgi:ribosomal protein L22